jgi:hypothetical protein
VGLHEPKVNGVGLKEASADGSIDGSRNSPNGFMNMFNAWPSVGEDAA